MRLNDRGLQNRQQWEKAGIQPPRFDRGAMIQATMAAPQWVHFGAGNIFRAFPAALAQSLLEQGISQTGIIVVAGYDTEVIDTCYSPFDNLGILVTLKSDGTTDKQVIASVAAAFKMDNNSIELKKIFKRHYVS